MLDKIKIALVYDRINKFGGAERLLLALHRIFPTAPIFTLVYEPKSSEWAKGIKIIPTYLNRIGFLRNKHEWLSPLAPMAFETLDLSGFDVIISITSGDAKAVITKPGQLHICYCLTPTRYFWSGEEEYSRDKKLKLIPGFLKRYFKFVDLVEAERPDKYISISGEVQKRVKRFYNRNSAIIYPPIEDIFYTNKLIPLDNRDYFLVVSRLVPYKKVDLAIKAFNKLKLPLVVVGIGSEMDYLKKISGPNITFTGAVDDRKLIEYYRHARAVIFPQEEDLGLVPLEAQASGTPVIAFGKGGALETVIDGKTGIFFPNQTVDSLFSAVTEFSNKKFNASDCLANAAKFNFTTFSREFQQTVKRLRN